MTTNQGAKVDLSFAEEFQWFSKRSEMEEYFTDPKFLSSWFPPHRASPNRFGFFGGKKGLMSQNKFQGLMSQVKILYAICYVDDWKTWKHSLRLMKTVEKYQHLLQTNPILTWFSSQIFFWGRKRFIPLDFTKSRLWISTNPQWIGAQKKSVPIAASHHPACVSYTLFN